MTKKEMIAHLDKAMYRTNKAYECAEEGNLSGAYVSMLMARESLHQAIRDYNNAKQESEAA